MTGRDLVSGAHGGFHVCACVSLSFSFSFVVEEMMTSQRRADRHNNTTRVSVSNDSSKSPFLYLVGVFFPFFSQHAANRIRQILEFQGKMRIDPSTHQEVLRGLPSGSSVFLPSWLCVEEETEREKKKTVRWPQPSAYQIRREKYSCCWLLSVSCSIPAHLLTVPTWRAIWNRLKIREEEDEEKAIFPPKESLKWTHVETDNKPGISHLPVNDTLVKYVVSSKSGRIR